MMQAVVVIAFWALLLSAGGLIAFSGDRAARRFLLAVVGATLLTLAVKLLASRSFAPYAYLSIDGALLLLAGYAVLKVDAFWPVWFAGFQLITVISEIARFIFSGPIPDMYANLAGVWAVPALLTMAIGVTLDRHFGITKPG